MGLASDTKRIRSAIKFIVSLQMFLEIYYTALYSILLLYILYILLHIMYILYMYNIICYSVNKLG